MQQDRRILCDRVKHYGALEFGRDLAEDMYRFVLQRLQMRIERRFRALRIMQFRFRKSVGHC